ncbi:MAG: sensor domain-containing diguanylate cyclase [Candidatus Hydrogenedentes bacterium]|nr:sensor domain-containing diguanylate cyclase [Candidatus Hydrogenedentota bacterium]
MGDVYRDILEHILDGVYFTDLERHITYWNEAAEHVTGYARGEVLGRWCGGGLLSHVDPEGRSLCRTACPLAAAMRDGTALEADVYMHHKAGHRVPVHVRVAPIRGEDGVVTGAVEIFRDSTPLVERDAAIERLQDEAELCPTTKVGNRRYVEARLEASLDAFRHRGRPFGVLFIDIDHFKAVNDTYGHDVGDNVLRTVAATLTGSVRAEDCAGRWGGEEFVVLLRRLDGAQALAPLAERCRALIERSDIPIEHGTITVTASIGGTCVRDDDTAESILKRADALMYRSKQEGRNRVTVD